LTGIAAYNLFFLNGLKLIEANRASLIVALNPVAIMTGGALLGVEKFTRKRFAGVLVALVGVGVVLTEGNFSDFKTTIGRGELLILGCVFSWVIYTLIGRSLVQDLSPLVVTTYSSVAGCMALALMTFVSLREISGFDLRALIAILFLGVFGTTLAFVWYYQGVKTLGPTSAGVFINLVPAWGVALSALLLNEQIVIATLLGGLGIVVGVFLTNWQS
jgi:drug/metabolite transporter (DMT)-like permease